MIKHNHQKGAKITWAVSLSLLMVVVVIALFSIGSSPFGFAQCQSGLYFVETDSGGYYGLVGLPRKFEFTRYTDHTTRISVNMAHITRQTLPATYVQPVLYPIDLRNPIRH